MRAVMPPEQAKCRYQSAKRHFKASGTPCYMTLVTAMPRAGLPMLSAIPVPGNPFRLC